jgi:hypothetical protein
MYVPHLDGVGQWPYFTSIHQCGLEVPRLLLGERDDRTPFNLVQPSHESGALTSPATRAALIKVLEEEDGIWEGMTGGGAGKRKYAINLHKFPEVKAKVEQAMSWYIEYVKHQYPALCDVKIGALKTSPNMISQYEQRYNRLHSDYQVECKEQPPTHRPILILIGLYAFKFMYLPTKYSSKKEIVTTDVAPGQMIMFTNN